MKRSVELSIVIAISLLIALFVIGIIFDFSHEDNSAAKIISNSKYCDNINDNILDVNLNDSSSSVLIPSLEDSLYTNQIEESAIIMKTKDDAFHMVLNSVDYYNYANGIIDTNFLNGSKTTIEYNVDMVDTKGYQHVIMDDFDEETFVENDVVYTINNLQDSNGSNYCRQTISQKKKNDKRDYSDDDKRISVKNGVPSYSYRLNPTNLHYASTVSIFAQEMAFGFLSNKSLWDITSYDTIFLDRLCISIEGQTEPQYGAKLNIKTFSMVIDKTTGIILYFEGRDEKGDVTSYSKTTSFSCKKSDIPSISICP